MDSQHAHKVVEANVGLDHSASTLDAGLLLAWARLAAEQLAAHKHTINALNVFPVPDSDTGSNMVQTMSQALAKAETLLHTHPDADAAKLAHALADGAVRGARGNSGVVLSQILRAVAATAAQQPIDAGSFPQALGLALEFVQTAIAKPVEGTIITVLRTASMAHGENTLAKAALVATENAKRALSETTHQLKELREANVVDAGGFGLVVFLDSLSVTLGNASLLSNPTRNDDSAATTSDVASTPPGQGTTSNLKPNAHAEQGVVGGVEKQGAAPQDQQSLAALLDEQGQLGTLEVMFYAEDADIEALTRALEPLGDCLIVAANGQNAATVHIHSEQAANVIATAYAHAKVSDLHLEVLPQTQEHAVGQQRVLLVASPPGALAQLFSRAGAHVVEIAAEHAAPQVAGDDAPHTQTPPLREQVVAQVVAEVQNLSAQRTGQQGPEMCLLPNGLLSKDELAAILRACPKELTIVATGALVRGLAALAVHDPRAPLAVATYEMNDATAGMRVLALRRAGKEHLTAAGACGKLDILTVEPKAGQNFNPQAVRAVHDTLEEALIGTARSMLQSGGEQVTVVLDAGALDKGAPATPAAPSASSQGAGTDTAFAVLGARLQQALGVEAVVYKADTLEALTGNIAEVGVE